MHPKSKRLIVIIAFLLSVTLMCVLLFFMLNAYIYSEKQSDETVVAPFRGTLTGEYVCLPHKDTSGPQTDECAFGIKTTAGEYYGVDLYLISQNVPEVELGDTFTANGLITPIEYLSTDHWNIYNIEGIFSATDSIQVAPR